MSANWCGILAQTVTSSKSTTDALNSILNDDDKAGDQGDPNGDRDANGDGKGGGKGNGSGTGVGNYQLAGRKVIAKPQPRYTCNEQGTVVVEISVDQNGRVISATPGVRGTTNSAKCLLDQAKQAALNTKFDSSDAAPEKQVGKIIYNFRLTE
ncbi:energy transducer TonB family protein [Flavobacterium cyanobacteriorum]|uniref:energy transducer TonB family protein n=1 Tax=Flavobacterium cyanobacteriorum TaxID=2022802 RepID=UPI001A9C4EEA|nr:energy transducer TonB [Flavobacterium cyanobacteriorum]